MASDLAPLPQGVTGNALVLQINDRLRRIDTALARQTGADVTQGESTAVAGAAEQRFLETLAAAPSPVTPAGFPVLRDTLANIPTGLNAGDTARRFYATDYQHWYRWTGAGWAFDDGDAGSGFIAWFTVAPRSGKWHLCDGATGVSESRADGTSGLVAFSGLAAGTMPDLVSTPAYLRGANACTGVVAAGSGAAFPAGAHTDPATAVIPVTTSGTGNAQITGNTANDTGAGQVVQSGAGVTVAAHPHVHATAPGVTDSGHQHLITVTDTGHQHNFTGVTLTAGEPRHMDALPYYRL